MAVSRGVLNVDRTFARRATLAPNLLDVAEGFFDFFAGNLLGVALQRFGD